MRSAPFFGPDPFEGNMLKTPKNNSNFCTGVLLKDPTRAVGTEARSGPRSVAIGLKLRGTRLFPLGSCSSPGTAGARTEDSDFSNTSTRPRRREPEGPADRGGGWVPSEKFWGLGGVEVAT